MTLTCSASMNGADEFLTVKCPVLVGNMPLFYSACTDPGQYRKPSVSLFKAMNQRAVPGPAGRFLTQGTCPSQSLTSRKRRDSGGRKGQTAVRLNFSLDRNVSDANKKKMLTLGLFRLGFLALR